MVFSADRGWEQNGLQGAALGIPEGTTPFLDLAVLRIIPTWARIVAYQD